LPSESSAHDDRSLEEVPKSKSGRGINNGKSTIHLVVRSNSVVAVNALLNSGRIQINSIAKCHELDKNLTPVEFAIHKRLPAVVEVLLQRGGAIPDVKAWPVHKRIFEILYNHQIANGVVLPKWRVFRTARKWSHLT
jgi:hypothetical protein